MLTDFGIAKRLDTPGLTTTGALVGTPDYMAPERIAGRPVDARTDVYALGMLAYRTLTGRRAFEGSTQDVLMGHLYQQPPPPSSLAPGLPAALDPVVLRAVAGNASARFPSAGAFVQALDAAVGAGATPVGRPPALPPAAHVAITPAAGIDSAPTSFGPTAQAARTRPPAALQAQGARAASTHTTITPAGRQPAPADSRGSAAPWIAAIILALVVGGLAVALGFMLGDRQGSAAAGGVGVTGSAPPSPTPSVTAVPTLAATSTPGQAADGGLATPQEPAPSATAAQAPSATTRPPPGQPATVEPTATPTLTPTEPPPPSPTETVEPTATDTPTPTVDCTEGLLNGGFSKLYSDDVSVRSRLGCPQTGERAGKGSEQFFVGGTMFYWGLNPTDLRDTIIVFFGLDRGDYTLVTDKEAASYPEPEPNKEDPSSPVRGFGRVYFNKAGVADALGGWTSPRLS